MYSAAGFHWDGTSADARPLSAQSSSDAPFVLRMVHLEMRFRRFLSIGKLALQRVFIGTEFLLPTTLLRYEARLMFCLSLEGSAYKDKHP